MEAQLRALLTGYAPLTALVVQRIFWNYIPQDASDPNVVLYKINGSPSYTMQGAVNLTGNIVQINVRALTVTSMWAVRDAIIAKLSGHRDAAFAGVFLSAERQDSEKPGTTLYHMAQLDFDVWHHAI
jgi:hypothetical protein